MKLFKNMSKVNHWQILLISLSLQLAIRPTLGIQGNIIQTTTLFPLCETPTERPVIFKDSEIILEVSNQVQNGTRPCPILFRSPFQCPHPYSVQVIENDSWKCRHNLQDCVLHQRVYWTKNGEIELNLDVDSFQFTEHAANVLIIHVARLKCDGKFVDKAESGGQQVSDGFLPVVHQTTKKLKIIIQSSNGNTQIRKQEVDNNSQNVLAMDTHSNPNYYPSPADNFLHYPEPSMPESTSFFLASPGFPRNPTGYSDCFYVIPRTNFPTCRLRISFRFFNLPDPDERTCQQHFLLIDNKRICGCKSGLIYLVQLDSRPKLIRYVNKLHPSTIGTQRSFGFLLEVHREGCPVRYQTATRLSRDREIRTPGFFGHRESGQQCQFNFYDWLQVISTPQWRNRRPQCVPGNQLALG